MKYPTRLSDAVHILAFYRSVPRLRPDQQQAGREHSDESCLCAPAHVRLAEGRAAGQREGTSPTHSGS